MIDAFRNIGTFPDMKPQIAISFRTGLLVSILLHLCALLLFSYGLESVKQARKDRYIAVELVRMKKGENTRKQVKTKREATPIKKHIPKSAQALPEKPLFTDYFEEAPVMKSNEKPSAVEIEKSDETGEEVIGGSPFESADSDIQYEPFHKVSVLPSFNVQMDPVYPPSERAAGRETKVVVEVYINTTGGVDRVEVIKSGGTLFDEAVVRAVKQSSFTPAIMDGRLVAVRVKIPYTFKLR